MLVKLVLLMKCSVNFTFFREGKNGSSSRMHCDVINVPKGLMPYISWKPRMSPTIFVSVFVHIIILIFSPNSTDSRFWIIVVFVYLRRKHLKITVLHKRIFGHMKVQFFVFLKWKWGHEKVARSTPSWHRPVPANISLVRILSNIALSTCTPNARYAGLKSLSIHLTLVTWLFRNDQTVDILMTKCQRVKSGRRLLKQLSQRRAAADRSRHKSYDRIQYQGPYFPT